MFLFFSGSFFSILRRDFPTEIKIFSLKILDFIIKKIPFRSYEAGFLINILELYQNIEEKPILDEILSIIIRVLSDYPQISQILMKSQNILKILCAGDIEEKYNIQSILILKSLYSDSKNIQILNLVAEKPFLERAVVY